jgi:hypothetical protein
MIQDQDWAPVAETMVKGPQLEVKGRGAPKKTEELAPAGKTEREGARQGGACGDLPHGIKGGPLQAVQ